MSSGWKLIHNLAGDGYELYDLKLDRQESLNLYPGKDETQQQVGAKLVKELKTFRIGSPLSARAAKMTEEEVKRLRSLGYLK